MEAKHESLFQQQIYNKERKKTSEICRNRYVIEELGEVEGASDPVYECVGNVRPRRV
jgi:hypothetical protein